MTPCSSPVRDVSGQEDCPDPTIPPEQQQQQQQQQQDENEEPEWLGRPEDQLSIHGTVTHAIAELEGLSLDINSFTRGKSDVVEVLGDDEDDQNEKDVGPESPVSPFDDPEGGSQTSSEESWASFPSSDSNSTDSSSDAGEEEDVPGAADTSLPSPGTTFKFHEEFGGEDDVLEGEDGPDPPPWEEFTMEEDDDGVPYPVNTGPWSSRAIPKWAFLRSSNSLPVLGLGPEDFYHGGSALRHEISAEEDDEDGKAEDGESSTWSQEIATVGVVYL